MRTFNELYVTPKRKEKKRKTNALFSHPVMIDLAVFGYGDATTKAWMVINRFWRSLVVKKLLELVDPERTFVLPVLCIQWPLSDEAESQLSKGNSNQITDSVAGVLFGVISVCFDFTETESNPLCFMILYFLFLVLLLELTFELLIKTQVPLHHTMEWYRFLRDLFEGKPRE